MRAWQILLPSDPSLIDVQDFLCLKPGREGSTVQRLASFSRAWADACIAFLIRTVTMTVPRRRYLDMLRPKLAPPLLYVTA
jgi:hypothetical protein